MQAHSVLVVGHSSTRCAPVLSLLRDQRCLPTWLSDANQAVPTISENSPLALVVLVGPRDFCEPILQFFKQFRSSRPLPPLLVVAVEGSEDFAVSALRAGASDYLPEPFDLGAFAASIGRLLPAIPIEEMAQSLAGGDELVGRTPTMQALRMNIRRIAATDCNVLITGETGTGKELVAQLIHQNSSRSKYPLICVNCAAIPDSLLESELFGYERGAFTGAHTASPGKLMTADKGTVFFDEIGDMSPCAQAKVLRAIETKEVQRLGSGRRHQTDIRVLAATHHDLDDFASTPSFRRDLYFRLNVGRVHLSPLRERKADIPNLVQLIVSDLNRKSGSRVEGISDEALARLAEYDWPGNVRELKNAIERIFITRQSGIIDVPDLPYSVQTTHALIAPTTAQMELCSLREALASCSGNKSRAAQRLNWSRMTLYRKMAKYGPMTSEGPAPSTDSTAPYCGAKRRA